MKKLTSRILLISFVFTLVSYVNSFSQSDAQWWNNLDDAWKKAFLKQLKIKKMLNPMPAVYLDKIFKLNDFANSYSLNAILQNVINSQFFDPLYTQTFGAFLINDINYSSDQKSELIYLKYSFHLVFFFQVPLLFQEVLTVLKFHG